jgi:broad specificity phosphatase PhoE
VLAELNDIRFGEFEGRLLTEYRAWAHSHGPDEPGPGGGDSRAQTVARYVAAYGELLDRPEASVLVVAHGLPVRYVLDALKGHSPAAAVAQVPYAVPFRLSAAQLEDAVRLLDEWLAAPAWSP